MSSKRQLKVAQQLRQTLSELIQFEVSDPRVSGVTVMEVTVDRELMYATIYVNSLEGEESQDEVMAGLISAAGFMRRELGKRIRLQYTPELRFKWDETLAHADRIDQLLKGIDVDEVNDEDPDA